MKKTIYTCTMMLLGTLLLLAQALPDEIKKLNGKMGTRHFSYKVTYQMYDAHQGGKLLETQQMDVSAWDAMISVKTRLFHMVRNREYYLYVDLSRKVMMLNKGTDYQEDMQRMDLLKSLVNVDSLVGKTVRTQLIGEKDGIKTYRFYLPAKGMYSHSDLTFDTRDLTVKKAVMYYRQDLNTLLGKHSSMAGPGKPRIEMIFRDFRYDTRPGEASFSLSSYVSKKGGRFAPQPLYARYEFINNTTVKK